MQLRLQGNAEARSGDLPAAIRLYTQALELDPQHGKHLLLANRAGAKLGLKELAGAIEDARAAVVAAPAGFTTGYIRLVSTSPWSHVAAAAAGLTTGYIRW